MHNTFKPDAVVSGMRWSGTAQLLQEGFRFGVSIILARLLAPQDFGLLAMASFIAGFLVLFQYLGTGAVIVQKKELSSDLIDSLFVLNLIIGLLLVAGMVLGSGALAMLYRNPEAGPVIQILGLSFVISSFGIVPRSLLNRDMRFDRIAKIGLAGVFLQGLTAIILAYLGWGVWALVTANLVNSIVSTVFLWLVSGRRPRLILKRSCIKEIMSFSLNLTGSNMVEYFTRNSDKFIIGRWLGSAPLGLYNIACRFSLFPLESMAPVLMRVLFPAFSRIQDDDVQLRRIFLRACGGIAFVAFPLMTGLCILASPFVLAVLGLKWKPIIPLIMLISPIGILQSISTPTNGIFLAKGHSDRLFRVVLVTGIVVTASIFCGLSWGIIGVASAYAIVMVPLTYMRFAVSFRLIKLKFSDLLASLRPYVIATALMAGLVLGCRLILEHAGLEPHWVLILSVASGIAVYAYIIVRIQPPALADFLIIMPGSHRRLDNPANTSDNKRDNSKREDGFSG